MAALAAWIDCGVTAADVGAAAVNAADRWMACDGNAASMPTEITQHAMDALRKTISLRSAPGSR